MSFLNVIEEALKSEREPDKSKKKELKVPQLDAPKWIENQKYERESKFKKTPDDHLIMDPSDGFFFHYQPEDNLLYTSNGSFNFIVGRKPRRRIGRSYWRSAPHSYDLEAISDNDYKVNDLNFRVNKKTKKIDLEKDWGGSKGTSIVAGRIKRPEQVRDAVKAAVHHFPELDNYTFAPKKEKVSEYTKGGVAALEQGGTMTAYFAALGEEMKEILQKGLTEDSVPNKKNANHKIQIHFDKKEAVSDTKNLSDSERLYHVVAVAQFEFSDPELLDESWGDQFKIAEGKSVPAKDIKIIKTNLKDFFSKSWTPVQPIEKFNDDPLVKAWNQKWNFIVIPRDEEEWKYFYNRQAPEKYTKRGNLKGSNNRWTWSNKYSDKPNPVGLRLRSGTLLLLFTPESTEEDLKKFLADRWWSNRDLNSEIPWQLKEKDEYKDIGYQIYFNHKFPEPVNYILMKSPFERRSSWRHPAKDMLKALGREVHVADEDE